jgi:hydroxymethylpyrimidine pyrophosphatase-like HAD family hydrolase
VNLRILALDFDGTIAVGDALDPDAAEAIREARAAGVLVILVTGRVLDDLDALLPETPLFDAIVAENGAVLRLPSQLSPSVLSHAPDPRFLAELTRRAIRHRRGSCVVDAGAEVAPQVLDAIRGPGASLGIAFNRDRLMVLPLGVTKGSGLSEALWRLRASGHNAVGIGDAENDLPLLEACEFGAAVAWGTDALRHVAEDVVPGDGPSGVARYIRGLLTTRRIPLTLSRRRWIRLGTRDGGQPLDIAVRGRNLLIGGDPKSGKSWVAGLLCEQLILQRYSLCILDPEGDYTCLEALPGVIVHPLSGEDAPLSGLERILAHPDLSLVVDMSGAPQGEKPALARRVLELAGRLRRRTGVPHRIVIDEAHYFLGRRPRAAWPGARRPSRRDL